MKQNKKSETPAAPKTYPLENVFFVVLETPYLWSFKAAATRKGDMSDMPSVQPTEQPRTSPPGSRGLESTCLDIRLAYMSAGVLCLARNGNWWWTMCTLEA